MLRDLNFEDGYGRYLSSFSSLNYRNSCPVFCCLVCFDVVITQLASDATKLLKRILQILVVIKTDATKLLKRILINNINKQFVTKCN